MKVDHGRLLADLRRLAELGKLGIMNFEANRRIEHYGRIARQRGAAQPAAGKT